MRFEERAQPRLEWRRSRKLTVRETCFAKVCTLQEVCCAPAGKVAGLAQALARFQHSAEDAEAKR